MVRGFGLLLVVGIAIAYCLALTVGFAALSLRREGVDVKRSGARGLPPDEGGLRARFSFSAPLIRRHPREERFLSLALSQPKRVLGVGIALALVGWALGTQIGSVSDVRALAPQGLRQVRDLNELQDDTGVSGELDVKIEAPDLTDPATLRWMAAFKHRVLRSGGFSGSEPSCLEAEVCPGPALSDFLLGGGGPLRRRDVRAALAELPAYDLEQVAPVDPKTGLPGHTALLSFGIRAQSLEDQQALIERVRGEIGEPGTPGGRPPGSTSSSPACRWSRPRRRPTSRAAATG